jgi:hypothetical protein
MKSLWKSFKKDLQSNNGNIKWEIKKWVHHEGKLEMCGSGLHASKKVIDAMGYTNLEELALVEVKGKHLSQDDKQCWEYMRIKKLYRWTKKDSVSLSIYAAELVLDIYEKEYPDDKRPRNAIEAAKKVLKNDNEENREAAWAAARTAASAAWAAAEAAAWAAASAAEASAEAAAWAAAEAAAWAAARAAARAAASAAEASAEAAAWAEIKNKCESFIQERIKTLEVLG